MIDTLDGIHEKVNFKNKSLIMFYDNQEFEPYPLHCHPAIEIIMPVSNSYTVISNNSTYLIKEGDILVMQPNVLHKMPKVQGRRFICQVSPLPIYSYKMYNSIRTLLPTTFHICAEKDPKLHKSVQELLYTIYNEYNHASQTSELTMYVSMLRILLLISKESTPTYSVDEKQTHTNSFITICDYINEHYAEKLTLEDVAQITGFSKFHFNRLFKKFTNETFYQYLNKIRIKNAEMFLSNPDYSITEVVYKCGFSTVSSFNRMFKIHHNCTPSEFRNMLYSSGTSK